MQRNGDTAVFAVLLDCVGDVVGTNLLVFQRAVGKISATAHEGVGQIRALNDGSGAEHLVYFNNSLCLGNGINIECTLGVVIFFGSLQNGSHRN